MILRAMLLGTTEMHPARISQNRLAQGGRFRFGSLNGSLSAGCLSHRWEGSFVLTSGKKERLWCLFVPKSQAAVQSVGPFWSIYSGDAWTCSIWAGNPLLCRGLQCSRRHWQYEWERHDREEQPLQSKPVLCFVVCLDFCPTHDLCITNTMVKHTGIHKCPNM